MDDSYALIAAKETDATQEKIWDAQNNPEKVPNHSIDIHLLMNINAQ